MNIFLSILLLSSSLLALSSLPYVQLNSKLLDVQEKLKTLSTSHTLLPIQEHYIDEYNKLTIYENSILKDSSIKKDEAKLYLKKLRKLSAIYEEVLSSTRVSVRKTIKEDNYKKFLAIINIRLPKLFEEPSFTQSAITYYEKNKKLKESSVMKEEIEYDKAKKSSKNIVTQTIKTPTISQTEQSTLSQTAQKPILTPNTQLRRMRTAYLDPKLFAKREKAFTPWMSKQEYQSRFDNGYYKRKNTYPAYIELDSNGNRRVLEIAYQPRFYWSCTSGRLYNKFKKIHVEHTVNGKKLLSIFIEEIDGLKIYTGVWLTNKYINRELLKLNAYGIYP